jgi:plasmid replication initiation protein
VNNQRGIVKHHNYISESIIDLELIELNIFVAIIYKIKGFKEITFDSKEIKKYSGSKERGYKRFDETIQRLQKRAIKLKTEKGYKTIMPFPTLDFNLEEKKITVKINEDILPLLSDLKKQFTLYSIDEFVALESKYSKRMFQMLKQYESIGKRTFTVDFLKNILVADYKRFYDLEKNVLKKVKDDINQKTSLKVDYVKNKEGRKINSVEFTVEKKTSSCDKKKVVFETRKDIIKRSLKTFNVKFIKDLDRTQKKILNRTLKQKGFNNVR